MKNLFSRIQLFAFLEIKRRRRLEILGVIVNRATGVGMRRVDFILEPSQAPDTSTEIRFLFSSSRGRGRIRRRGIITAWPISQQERYRSGQVRDVRDGDTGSPSNLILYILNRSPSLCIFPRPLRYQFNCHFCGPRIIFTRPKSPQPSEMPPRLCS